MSSRIGEQRHTIVDSVEAGSPMQGLSSTSFREVMASFPTGVTVITTVGENGAPIGLTANAVSSVSLDPPQLLICIGKERFTAKAIHAHQAFAVNFLARAQLDLAQRFASPIADKFAGVTIKTGWKELPLIEGTLASAECEVQKTMDVGDHFIFVGLVRRGSAVPGDPLMFFRREYAGWPKKPQD